jgi:hypothetical protein
MPLAIRREIQRIEIAPSAFRRLLLGARYGAA